jgi:hypothetical protein
MEEVTYTAGWFLPKGVNVQPTEIMVPSDASMIAELIGCSWVDAVRNDVASKGGDHATVVGYVDDEGLLKNPHISDMNHLAMTLFARNDAIFGDVIVVCGTNENGVYDGDNHDLPTWLTVLSDDLTNIAAHQYNNTMKMMISLLAAVEAGVVDRSEIEAELEREDPMPSEDFVEIMAVSTRYAEMLLESDDDENTGIVEGCEQLLEGE